MPEQPAAWRPDDETLAAYIDGRLAGDERARVVAAIAADPESYEWLVNALQAMAAEAADRSAGASGTTPTPTAGPPLDAPAGRVVPFRARHPWLAGGLGALAAAALVVLAIAGHGRWWARRPVPAPMWWRWIRIPTRSNLAVNNLRT